MREIKGSQSRRYRVILKGGKEQTVTAISPKEACQKVRRLLPNYEIVGIYEF